MNREGIPGSFKTTVADRFISAFFERKADIMIQVEMTMTGHLDVPVLEKALDLVLDAEPILGCRFSVEGGQVVWRRLDPDNRANFTEFHQKEEYEAYKNTTLDSKKGPALLGGICHRTDGDIVLLKIAHEAADAGGAKEIAYLVASIYRRLKKDKTYKPPVNLPVQREVAPILNTVPWHAWPRIWLKGLKDASPLFWKMGAFHNPFPATGSIAGREYLTCEIPKERLAGIKDYGNRSGAKLNDLLFAAYLRALSRVDWDRKSQLRCAMTVDLRQWYPLDSPHAAVANLSSLEILNLNTVPGSNFQETLEKVVAFTNRRKNDWIGLALHGGLLRLVSRMGYPKMRKKLSKHHESDIRKKRIVPIMTNLGPLDAGKLRFESSPLHAWVVVPAGFPPFFGIGISGYRGSLTISSAAFPRTRDQVTAIFRYMLEELPKK